MFKIKHTIACVLLSVASVFGEPQKDESVAIVGDRVDEYEQTKIIVRRTIAMDIEGKPEEKDIDIPVVIRTGSVYLEADAAARLIALRSRIADFVKKSEELEKMGESIKTEYLAIMKLGRPDLATKRE